MDETRLSFHEGWNLIFQGKYQDAVSWFSTALERDNDQASTIAMLAIAHYFSGDYENAEEQIRNAFSIDPESAIVYTAHGMLREGRKDHIAARQDHDRAIRISPDNCFSRTRSAWNYWLQGKNKEALVEVDWLLANKPEYFYAHYVKGRILFNDGKPDDALQAFTKAIQLKNDFVLAYHHRGILLRKQEKYQEALIDFSKAVGINPDHDDSLFERAWCLGQLGKVDDAINAYTTYIQKNGKKVTSGAFNNRGLQYQKKGDLQKALADYEMAIKIEPTNKYPWANRGDIKMNQGDLIGAIDDTSRALALDPKYDHAINVLRNVYEKKGDFSKALAATAHLRQISPRPRRTYDDPKTQFFTDTVYNHFGKIIYPALKKNSENFVDYWEVQMMWGARQSQSINQGTSSIVHEGKYGAGYIVLAEKNIWIINIGELSKRYIKTTGLVGKFFLAALRTLDMRDAEKNDTVFCVPHSDIQFVNLKDGTIAFGIGSDNWEIVPWFNDSGNYILTALNLARKDRVGYLWEPLVTPPQADLPTRPPTEDIYAQIEKLKRLLDLSAITKEQYDTKVQDLLNRL